MLHVRNINPLHLQDGDDIASQLSGHILVTRLIGRNKRLVDGDRNLFRVKIHQPPVSFPQFLNRHGVKPPAYHIL